MKKINALWLMFGVVLLAACNSTKPSPGQDVKGITIKYTELGRQTLFKISCESFDKYFPKPMVMHVVSKPAIDSLMLVIDGLKRIEDEEVDVRAKIYIANKDNKTDTLCLGITTLKYRQGTYQTPQKLLMMIQQ
ncbi:MAG: hypothetical protein V4592_25975 [Bacteroidota bacterium]